VKLIKVASSRSDSDSLGVIIEPLPSGTIVAVARRARIAPDPAIIVKLIKSRVTSNDFGGLWIVIEPSPAPAIVAIARRPVNSQISPIVGGAADFAPLVTSRLTTAAGELFLSQQ
jgi:hypothetical protein